jgi:secondary thiamine-phosphate synthase enzyme
MVVVSKVLSLSTSQRRQLIDITDQVQNYVSGGWVHDGICTISAPHATAAIIANENENGLVRDILAKIEDLFPESSRYAHNAIDDNADAHLAAAFLGHSRSFPITKGRLVRGTWQNIFLVELDGPRSRREIHLQLIGDG